MISRMRRSDLDDVVELERRTFPTPWPRTLFERDLPNDGINQAFVARDGDGLVGYLISWLVVDELHIGNIAVTPGRRRSGTGTALLTHVLDLAREREVRRVTLEVRVSNAAAIALYRKFGFNEVAIRKGYYADDGEDALVMLLDLAADSE
jgi:ribosomal-protein-alanine N-acetyltransferase